MFGPLDIPAKIPVTVKYTLISHYGHFNNKDRFFSPRKKQNYYTLNLYLYNTGVHVVMDTSII